MYFFFNFLAPFVFLIAITDSNLKKAGWSVALTRLGTDLHRMSLPGSGCCKLLREGSFVVGACLFLVAAVDVVDVAGVG